VEAGNRSKIVAIDIEGVYAFDENALAAAKRLRARMPKSGSCGPATARCTASEDAMITGTVNPDRQVTIWLPVRGPDEREIEAVVEGIDWFIMLPPAFTVPLGLTSGSSTRGDEEWRRS
jgi:hypothetical protein